jgi:hypothetical protein
LLDGWDAFNPEYIANLMFVKSKLELRQGRAATKQKSGTETWNIPVHGINNW